VALRQTPAQLAALTAKTPTRRPQRPRQANPGVAVRGAVALEPKRGGNARRTEAEGLMFDSKREAARFMELRLLEKSGAISGLQAKCAACRFPLVVNGQKVADYYADYVYFEDGVRIVEDSKSGKITAVYRLKKRLMLACHGIKIRETK